MSRRGLPVHLKLRHDVHFVDQLAARGGAPIGRMIPMDRLDANPGQPRVDMGDLSELEASIREKGILEPLLVKPLEDGRFLIISGERRYRAASLVGLREVPCIELDVDDSTLAEIALIENLQRKDLTPFEEADGLNALVQKFGYTHQEIAERIGKSRSSVTESLSLAALPEEVREQCRRADIQSKSMLLQVVRQPDSKSMKALICRIQTQGLGRETLRQERRNDRPESRRKPSSYRFRGDDFVLDVRFRQSEVRPERVIECLLEVIASLRSRE